MAKQRRRQPVVRARAKTPPPPPASRTRRTPAAQRRSARQPVVTIGMLGDVTKVQPNRAVPVERVDVPRDPQIVRIAEEWAYILRSRTRWKDDDDVRETYRQRALDDLERLGVPPAFMKRMASRQHVEVELHAWEAADAEVNAIHEAAAELPWEYLLSAGTRGVGRHEPILITRLFRNDAPAVIPPPPERVLFIASSPGRIEYEFDSERRRIAAAVGADGTSGAARSSAMKVSETQNLSLITSIVREGWDVLHVTGVDTHQAAWEIDDFYDEFTGRTWSHLFDPPGNVRDGMILRERNVAELPVPYDDLAAALVAPKRPPSLVTLNLYYSGARTARELVRRGAYAALGFLDEIDDELAERFFQEFYWAWCRPGDRKLSFRSDDGIMSIPLAFRNAWYGMPSDGLHGTAIVIWLGRSIFEELKIGRPPAPIEMAQGDDRQTRLAQLAARPIGELLDVKVEADDEVNYSLLHNDRPLLTTLTLSKLVKEPLEDIAVQVELNLGAQNYPFRQTYTVLDEPQLALAGSVRIPLTASLPRSLRERVRSTVYTKVTCGGRVAHESTRRVTLIPVDEWVDDTEENPWLPSFVLPRDPAILTIVSASRRYLVGIADDPAAGFDGYQSVDDQADDPSAGVDAQVRAIWTAVVNEFRLQYINPPPAYSDRSQRLRTPSDILGSNSGTCIDLALLLASCLEYIDVYPVVVLLTGHAFAGYWRTEKAHDDFVEVLNIPADVPAIGSAVARKAAVRFVEPYGWRMTRLHYDEIMEYVTSGDLVMLEATYLTSASSFAEAVEEGRANMRSRREFDSLLDIRLARSADPPVTPLPIIND